MGAAFRERLRRLRREGAEPAKKELPTWLRRKLDRGAGPLPASPSNLERTAGDPQGLLEWQGPCGAWWGRERFYPDAHVHGRVRLGDARSCPTEAFEALTGGRTTRDFDVEGALHFDIETTGLSGGAGTHTYMVGLGSFESTGLRVTQAFLRGPEPKAERALLAACAERIEAASGLVSFFGKSFDRHRLEDKMRQHGVQPPFEGKPHLDLYWPCRKLYGHATEDTRLATMESALCGLQRANDLPGSHAPAAWFDYLAGRAHLLEHVFQHNLDDVLSLVTLMDHVGRSLEEVARDGSSWTQEAPGLSASRARAWSRELARGRRFGEALTWIERAEGRLEDAAGLRAVRLDRALLLAREGRLTEAQALLEDLVDTGRDEHSARAGVELACLGWKLHGALPGRCEGLAEVRSELERWVTGRERARLQGRLATLEARLRKAAAKVD